MNTPTMPTGRSSNPIRNQPSSYSATLVRLGASTKKARMTAAQKPLRTNVSAPPAHSP
jgi:hypothetical protein